MLEDSRAMAAAEIARAYTSFGLACQRVTSALFQHERASNRDVVELQLDPLGLLVAWLPTLPAAAVVIRVAASRVTVSTTVALARTERGRSAAFVDALQAAVATATAHLLALVGDSTERDALVELFQMFQGATFETYRRDIAEHARQFARLTDFASDRSGNRRHRRIGRDVTAPDETGGKERERSAER
jgi:hypothetical protein